LQPGFRQARAGLRHAFDTLSTFFVENLVANLLHQSRHVEIDAAGSLVRARALSMFARPRSSLHLITSNMLPIGMECRNKTRFEPANELVVAGFSLCIFFFVLIMT